MTISNNKKKISSKENSEDWASSCFLIQKRIKKNHFLSHFQKACVRLALFNFLTHLLHVSEHYFLDPIRKHLKKAHQVAIGSIVTQKVSKELMSVTSRYYLKFPS